MNTTHPTWFGLEKKMRAQQRIHKMHDLIRNAFFLSFSAICVIFSIFYEMHKNGEKIEEIWCRRHGTTFPLIQKFIIIKFA